MFQDRLALLHIRLDVADEFLGFRLEAGGHVAHVTRRDVCGCFRFVRVTGEDSLRANYFLILFLSFFFISQREEEERWLISIVYDNVAIYRNERW